MRTKKQSKTIISTVCIVAIFLAMILLPGVTFADEQKAAETSIIVPAGTTLLIRMVDTIDSRSHKAGHKFTALLEADLVVNNAVAAPRDSRVYGELVDAKSSGRLVGKSELSLALTNIMINNTLKPIVTDQYGAVSEGTGKNTVGNAARGAIIGALIDGSDGAKTGAKVGVGVSVLTRGEQINIPRGTLLEFRLAAPFTP